MKVDRIDHFVLTVASIDTTCDFYQRVLGFERHSPEGKPTSLSFGRQKINVHQADRTFDPKAHRPTPGAADFCLVTLDPIDAVVAQLDRCGVAVEKGPIERTGAVGPMMSVYFRDPDGNLVEVSRYLADGG
jgi:catechol 2,3-dioxygenase-like lactoylglutathione lyase family enzyme